MQPMASTKSYNSKIINLAIPNILSNLSVPLLGAVDTAIVGRLDELYYLGAIAVGSLVFDFIFWGFGFLRMGTTGLVAQALGASNHQMIQNLWLRVALFGSVLGLALIVLQNPIAHWSLVIISPSAEVAQYATEYIKIRIWAAPATLLLYGMNGWFLGVQNARIPMIITIVLNIINLVLNVVFVLVLDWKVVGIAFGSVIASYLGLFLALCFFFQSYAKRWASGWWREWQKSDFWEPSTWKEWLGVNRDIFIRTLCLIFAYAYFTTTSARAGDLVLATNTILLQLWYISSYGIDGFAYAAESLSGMYWGQKNTEAFKQVVRKTMQWGLGLGLSLSALFYIGFEPLFMLFTDKPAVVEHAQYVMLYTVIAPIVNSICFIWDGVYMGTSNTKPLRNTMLVATFLLYVPLHLFIEPYAGIHAIWMAMILFMIARGVFLSILAPRYFSVKLS
jgi:MATE family multidrug resistance protein